MWQSDFNATIWQVVQSQFIKIAIYIFTGFFFLKSWKKIALQPDSSVFP